MHFKNKNLKVFKNSNCVCVLIQCKSESQFIEVDFSQPAFVTAAHFFAKHRTKGHFQYLYWGPTIE